MADVCATHPGRNATGRCVRCSRATCPLCVLDVDGTLYCSLLCFTEQTLEAKEKPPKRKPPAGPDPLSSIDFKPAPEGSLNEPSVVLGAEQAQPTDESSILMSAASEHEPSETSILDMAALKRAEAAKLEDSSVEPMPGKLKDPTSILGMAQVGRAETTGSDGLPTWLEEPPKPETPLPMLLPGTRRSTLQSICVFHPDTPAVVRCSACGDPICTLCIADESQGGRCSPRCRRDIRRSRRNQALIAIGCLAAALLLWRLIPTRPPEPEPKPVAATQPPKADPVAEERERQRLEAVAREEARQRQEARAKEAALKAEAEAKEKAEALSRAEALAKAEAEAREAARKAEAKAREEAFAKAAADAREALAKAEAEAKAKAEAIARAEALAKAEADAKGARARAEAEARARAKAEAEARAKAEAEAAARAKREAKAKEEAAALALRIEKSLAKASELIREATPEFCGIAEGAETPLPTEKALWALLARIEALQKKLARAREEYVAITALAPDRSTVERRIGILGELIRALEGYRSRCEESATSGR
ncbi:MAG: hypothetical protein HY293_14705 [Planctomycetes bacterium]|nr:hypothetical protein [Planctomycetota bacterium]